MAAIFSCCMIAFLRFASVPGRRAPRRLETLILFEPAVVEPAVSFLAHLARSGTALELGIGTGRLALPLSQRGIRVHGIELSPAMAARLQTKPGADGIGVTIGDFATATVSGTSWLAYLVRNTIHELDHPGRPG
jgi:16S rRNA A1518/A1519 N6-dimethyltransferase RsmA/KsgA/DIM1 with predicted DNA glycosylase/AP lyase activity